MALDRILNRDKFHFSSYFTLIPVVDFLEKCHFITKCWVMCLNMKNSLTFVP